jgi:hypothetical protein
MTSECISGGVLEIKAKPSSGCCLLSAVVKLWVLRNENEDSEVSIDSLVSRCSDSHVIVLESLVRGGEVAFKKENSVITAASSITISTYRH